MVDKSKANKTLVLQHDISDCGPACLLSLLRYYDGNGSIDNLRTKSGTNKFGTTMLGMFQAAKEVGFEASGVLVDNIDELKKIDKPCILAVTINNFSHYVVCYGYFKNSFVIGDPGRGIVNYSPDELLAIWKMSCLLLEPTDKIEKDETIKKKKKLWIKQLVSSDYGYLLMCLAIGLILSVMSLSMSVFSQKLVDSILPSKNSPQLIVGLTLLFIITCTIVYLTCLRSKLILKQSQNFNNRSIRFFFDKILHLPKSFFDSHKRGDMITRLGDTRRIQSVISNIFNDYIINVLVLLTTMIFLFFYSWKIALLSIVSAPICFWIIFRKNKTIMNLQRDVLVSYAICESGFINTFEGISYIKSYQKQDDFLNLNCCNYETMQKNTYLLGDASISIAKQSGLVNAVVQIGMLAFGTYLVFHNQLSIGQLMAIIGVSSTFFSSVGKLAVVIIPINEAKVVFERMFEFANTVSESAKDSQYNKGEEIVQSLDIENMSFRFTGRKKLLNDISIKMKRGNITCLVGESGCGKSTLCQIIEGFYSPCNGSITINGKDRDDYSQEAWRSMISYIPQDMFLLNGTILENICFGSEPEKIDSIIDFCNKYELDEYFKELPLGLLTIVGEEGVNLSGGQKQIVALARALYSSKPILMMDEITSAMDRNTENKICKILSEIKKDKLIIFVTHRLETAKRLADSIVVIEDGRVSASGTHDELMLSDNFYSGYWHSLNA